MLKIFQPDYIFLILLEITPIWLKSRGFTALILDVDNTLLSRKAEYLPAKHKLWLEKLLQVGIKITLVTNSGGPKVKMLEDSTCLKVVNWAAKPLPFAFQRALKNLEVPKEQVLVVGDQLFTDVLGAHLSGWKQLGYVLWMGQTLLSPRACASWKINCGNIGKQSKKITKSGNPARRYVRENSLSANAS
jgi:HAD superfamily phosphatase (TIGR01668 family)